VVVALSFVLRVGQDTILEVHGYAKQGAGFGYTSVRGLSVLHGHRVTTPASARPPAGTVKLHPKSNNTGRHQAAHRPHEVEEPCSPAACNERRRRPI
jgi:hypothetical protein